MSCLSFCEAGGLLAAMRTCRPSPVLRNKFTKPISHLQHSRSFKLPPLSSFAPTLSSPAPRSLTASKTLPYPPLPLFRTISAVEAYGEFLPFLNAANVTARDTATGYPSRAHLTVGYGPLSETFLSRVECSEVDWAVSARSGERAFRGQPDEDKHAAGLFEYLDTIWKLEPLEASQQQQHLTKVQLSINFKFRSAMHAAMMSAVENQVAEAMVDAFEKRFKAVYGTH